MANWGAGAAGGLTGAGTGAYLGSFFPGVGTAIGAGAGGTLGFLTGLFGGDQNNTLTGSNPHTETTQNFTPQQQQLQDQSIQQIMQLMGQGNKPDYSGFQPIEDRARQQFSTNTIPGLAERFTSLGGQGGQRSSAFQGALGQYGSDLEGQLAGLRSQYGLQQQGLNQQHFGQLLDFGSRPSFERQYIGGEPGLIRELLPFLIKALAKNYGPQSQSQSNPLR